MGKNFVKTDIAITSGGVTKLEISSLGIPAIVLCQNTNEDFVAKNFEKHKTLINLGIGTNVEFERFYEVFNTSGLSKMPLSPIQMDSDSGTPFQVFSLVYSLFLYLNTTILKPNCVKLITPLVVYLLLRKG